jgi:hypothetical protein
MGDAMDLVSPSSTLCAKTAFETHSAECAALMSVFVRRVERRVTTATD